MTRLGLAIGGAFALTGAALISVTSFGAEDAPAARPAPEPAGVAAERYWAPGAPIDLGRISVPVIGVAREALLDTWGQPRAGGERSHEAIDIAAPGGTPVVAAATGTVEKLFVSEAGGNTVYLRSPDRRWSFYYAHLQGYAPGLAEGARVEQGQLLGFVGDTGNAGAGNTHLHFGIARMRTAEEWHGGEPVNPYPLLAGRDGPG